MADSTTLGADLFDLWNAGKHMLPAAAESVQGAWNTTPASIKSYCTRSGPIGLVPDGPGQAIDNVLEYLNRALSDSAQNLRLTGDALVWLANQYAATDADAKAEFDRKKRDLGDS